MNSYINKRRCQQIKKILYPCHGFLDDVKRILNDFNNENNLRYQCFLSLWQGLNFSCIHMGRQGNREAIEFMEEAWRLVLPHLFTPYTLPVRVGCMYLVYGLWCTQMARPKVCVRVSIKQWKVLCAFCEELKESDHLDVVYIFRLMKDVEHTFQIVADSHYDINKDVYDENYDDFDLEYQQELELQYRKELGKKQNMFEFLVGESLHNYLNADDLVDQLNEAQKKYIEHKPQLKKELMKNCTNPSQIETIRSSLDMIDEKSLDEFNLVKKQGCDALPKKNGNSQTSSSFDALNRDELHKHAAEQIHIDQTLRDIDRLIREHRMSGDAVAVQSDADQHVVVDGPEDARPSMVVFNKFMNPNRKASDVPLPAPAPSAGPLLEPVARKKGKKAAKGPPKKRGRKPKTEKGKNAVSVSPAPAVSSVAAESSNVPVAKTASPSEGTSAVVGKPTKKAPGKKRGRKKKVVKS